MQIYLDTNKFVFFIAVGFITRYAWTFTCI